MEMIITQGTVLVLIVTWCMIQIVGITWAEWYAEKKYKEQHLVIALDKKKFDAFSILLTASIVFLPKALLYEQKSMGSWSTDDFFVLGTLLVLGFIPLVGVIIVWKRSLFEE